MVIVDPCRKNLPPHLAHLAPQIEMKPQTAAHFFAEFRDQPLTPTQIVQQQMREALRPEFEQKAAKKW